MATSMHLKGFQSVAGGFPKGYKFETSCLVVAKEEIEPLPIKQERMPSENEGAEQTAKEIIKMLDDCCYSKEQVYAIATWAKFMATQS